MKFLFVGIISLVLGHFQYNKNTVNDLHIQINNIPSAKGNIMIAVYNTADGFREKDHTYKNMIVAAQKGGVEVTIPQLPTNNYAVAVYHDSNGNGKLDKNFFGVPTEYYGFSNDARGSFGPPSFGDCSFVFNSAKKITINLK
jgi:uncharacterized protein (DUF2141 family)